MQYDRNSNIVSSYLVLIKDGKTLLARRCNTGYRDGFYSLVAGHVEENETFTDALVREIAEESGIKLFRDKVRVAHIMHRKCGDLSERVDTFFVTEDWSGEVTNSEPDKCDDLSWFKLDELPDNVIPYIKQALECIVAGQFYSEHGWGK